MRSVLFLFLSALPLLAQSARVEGRVVTPEGRAVPKATVHLQATMAAPGQQPNVYVEVAASDGSFAFNGVAPGTYQASAQMIGYNAPPSSPSPTGRRPGSVTVAAGETKKGMDLTLIPLGVVGGTVSDRDGDPVANVQVTLLHYGLNQGRLSLLQSSGASTDDRGVFRITNVQAGRYYLRANSQNFGVSYGANEIRGASAQEVNQPTYYPSSPDLHGATRLDVGSAPVEDLRIRMVSGRIYTIRGVVEGAGPNRYPNLQLLPKGQPALPLATSISTPKLPEFEIHNVPPGDYILSAQIYETQPVEAAANGKDQISVNAGGTKTRSARVEVSVSGGDVDNIVLRPDSGIEVTGRLRSDDGTDWATFLTAPPKNTRPVPLDTISVGTSISRGGGPGTPARSAPSAYLNFIRIDEGPFYGNPQVQVKEDGTFTATDLQPGSYMLNYNGGNGYLQSVRFGDRDFIHEPVQIASGGKMEIVISKSRGKLRITSPSRLSDGNSATDGFRAYVWPVIPDRSDQSGRVQSIYLNPTRPTDLTITPGDYYVAVFEEVPSQELARVPEFLARFNNSAARVAVVADQDASIEPAVISREVSRKVYEDFP